MTNMELILPQDEIRYNFRINRLNKTETVKLETYIGKKRRHVGENNCDSRTQLSNYKFDKPHLIETTFENLPIRLDDFYPLNSQAEVIEATATLKRVVNIETALRSFKHAPMTENDDLPCYTVILDDKAETSPFEIPEPIREFSLYYRYWPSGSSSKYLSQKNLMFTSFLSNHKSRPYQAYGGMSEWIFVIFGTLKMSLFKPTKLNQLKYSSLSPDEEFVPEEDTSMEFILQLGSLLIIPTGYISTRYSIGHTNVFSGEFLHDRDLESQLEAFKVDVTLSNNAHCFERDKEIRALYWFYASHFMTTLMNNSNKNSQVDMDTFEILRKHLNHWKDQHKALPSDAFIPDGICFNLLLKDFQLFISSTTRKRRKSDNNNHSSMDNKFSSPVIKSGPA